MSEILLHYKRPDPITWVYLSSFLTFGLYFAFHRFWSMRNLDLLLLVLLAPGLLIVQEARRQKLIAIKTEVAEKRLISTAAPNPLINANEAKSDETKPLGPDGSDAPTGEASNSPGANTDAEPSLLQPDASAPDNNEPATLADSPTASVAGNRQAADEDIPGEDSSPEIASGPEIAPPRDMELYGFIWLLAVQALILLRLIFDPLMVRRPLLDPNLTAGGLMFIGFWMFVFLMANVITNKPDLDVEGPRLGPGYSLMNMLPAIPSRPLGLPASSPQADDLARDPLAERIAAGDVVPSSDKPLTTPQDERPTPYVMLAKFLAIVSHLAIVVGIVSIGYRHFGNFRSGIGCATLYLLLPYTAQMTGRVDHALPAALLIWAVFSYRRPFIAGTFLGVAAGLVYYPLFLLPLWVSFYRPRGVGRFLVGVVVALACMVAMLLLDDSISPTEHLRRMFGLMMPQMEGLKGVWGLGWQPIYRLPLLVGFLILAGFFSIWPAQKNLGTLIAYTAAVMVAAQFWHAYGGGLYIGWFLPLLLLTIYRPNLEDRVAIKVISGLQASPIRPRTADAA
jgi:hypothetical protein